MAEIVIATPTPESAKGQRLTNSQLVNLKQHRHMTLTVTVTSSGDVFTAGTSSAHPGAIVACAWEPVNSGDPMAAVLTATSGLITFTGTSGSEGILHLWVPR